MVSAANNQPVISPNSLATIYGANLALGAASGQPDAVGVLPTALGGASVSVAGKPAQLLYVSPQQINFLVPSNAPLGPAAVNVSSATTQASAKTMVPVALTSPGLFTLPCVRPSRGAVLNGVTFAPEPFQASTSRNAATDKRTRLSLFGTGLRFAGNAAQNSSLTNVAGAITALATDSQGAVHNLPVEYAGPAPNFAGLDQVNVVVPADLDGAGLVNLQLQSGNTTSNPISIVMAQSGTAQASNGSFNISTVAGTGAMGNSGDGNSALSAALGAPTGVAVDPQHNLYIASAANHVVRRVAPSGVITAAAGTGVAGSSGDGGIATQAQLTTPMSVAADSSGNLYIADAGANKIRRIASDGTISTFAGTGTAGFSGDGGLASAAQLSSPSAVAVDQHGSVLIADTGNNRLRKVTSDGVIETTAGTGIAGLSGDGGAAYLAALNAPDSIATGSDGSVYVADEGNHRIRRIAPDGTITSLMSSSNLVPITLAGPVRLAMNANQQLFVSDSQDQNIASLGSSCQLTPVAGTGSAGFSGDNGAAVHAQVSAPASMATDSLGNVYFADSNNNRVRRLSDASGDSTASISFSPSPATSGMTVNGLVQLSHPASQPTILALSSIMGLHLPSTLTIPQGQTTGAFSFQAPADSTSTGFQVTASDPEISATGTAVVVPPQTAQGELNMAIAPASAPAGAPISGLIRLAHPASSGGAKVALSSNNPAAHVAGDAVVPQGQTTAEFNVATAPVTQTTPVTITATSDGATTTGSLSVMPTGASTISSLSVSPTTLTAGQIGSGTVTLQSPAASGGGTVNLSTSSPALTVPQSLSVPEGETTATFPVTASLVASPSTATVTATSANSVSASVDVNPASGGGSGSPSGPVATIASLAVTPSTVTSGQTATGTVTLAAPAPSDGVVVGLASNSPAATVPVSVTVPAGQTTATFAVSTSAVLAPATATITAASANTMAASLTVNPASGGQQATIGGVSVSPSSVSGGQSATGTITLASPAPASGALVSLSSNSTAASVPASVTIPSGETTATVPISTSTVSTPTQAQITATSANSMTATLTINPTSADCVGNISLSRSAVIGGNNVDGTVTLTQPAPQGGQTVSLGSSSANANVPTTVTVPAGQRSAGFAVGTRPVLSTDNPVISASTGACANADAGLTLLPAGSLPLGL
ncbi:MAG TPA: hypothetical protein VFW44_16890 [Bryobacteraceae bacterium]|nr:hypothetical protein [Bryobacteraceae bacterium]